MLPTPYYAARGVTLYCGDAAVILPQLGSTFADLLVTDPPYGVGYESGQRQVPFGAIVGDHNTAIADAVLPVAVRAVRENRHVLIFGKFDLTTCPLSSRVELVWDKGKVGMGDLSLPYSTSHEYITFGVRVCAKNPSACPRGRLAARLRRGSVLRHNKVCGTANSRHPTEKPVTLLRELIESSSCMGDTVFDPFAGSGSTLVAALLEGRKAIGIELEERYCAVAAKRLAAVPEYEEQPV